MQWSNVWAHPKSTIVGACGLIISVTLAIGALPPKASVPVVLVAVLRAVVMFLSQDAGTTLAKLPGVSEAVPVPSHEVPDDPQAKPLK